MRQALSSQRRSYPALGVHRMASAGRKGGDAMTTRPRLRLANETLTEITRRAASDEQWAKYLLLIQIASGILEHAPKSIQECEELDLLKRVGDDLEAMTIIIHQLFPGGLKEAWFYYLPERMRQEESSGTG